MLIIARHYSDFRQTSAKTEASMVNIVRWHER